MLVLRLKPQPIQLRYSYFKLEKLGWRLNLKRIWETQKLSESLIDQILDLAKTIRANLLDIDFRDGNANPSMFARKIIAWEKFKEMDYELTLISKDDLLTKTQER